MVQKILSECVECRFEYWSELRTECLETEVNVRYPLRKITHALHMRKDV